MAGATNTTLRKCNKNVVIKKAPGKSQQAMPHRSSLHEQSNILARDYLVTKLEEYCKCLQKQNGPRIFPLDWFTVKPGEKLKNKRIF